MELYWLSSRRLLAFLAGLLTILVLGVGILWLRAGRPLSFGGRNISDLPDTARSLIRAPKATPTPVLVPSLLTGELVAPDAANLRPLGVMIENHPDARPQSGLASANLVYEAIAEGGITRFLAVFADPRADVRVGPIRSARSYFVDFATELGAMYAHVGGNLSALQQIDATKGFFDLNQFAIGGPTFWRDNSRKVATEHTMYSATNKLWQYAAEKRKYDTKASFTPWQFANEPPVASRAAAQTITVNFSSASYKVDWAYDPTANNYTRAMAGKPHLDATNSKVITAKTVILHTVSHQMVTGPDKEREWKLSLTGSGSARVFMNGTETAATWKKSGASRTKYFDSNGQELVFPRGNIWVEIIHPETSMSITTPTQQ